MSNNSRLESFQVDTNVTVADPSIVYGPFALGGAKVLVVQPIAVSGAHDNHVLTLYGSNVWGQASPLSAAIFTALSPVTIGNVAQLTTSVYELSADPGIGCQHLVAILTTAEGGASVTKYHMSIVY